MHKPQVRDACINQSVLGMSMAFATDFKEGIVKYDESFSDHKPSGYCRT